MVRFLRGFVLLKGDTGPVGDMYDFTRADTVLDNTVYCVMTRIGTPS